MSADCTNCGYAVPLGQFRCGRCGAVQNRDSMEDLEPGAAGVLAVVPRDSPADPGPRESIVPRGTFASDEPGTAVLIAQGPDAEEPSQVRDGLRALPSTAIDVAVPVAPVEPAPKETSMGLPTAPSPMSAPRGPKPPFLASEILREDLMPAEPGRQLLTLCLQLCGVLGLLAAGVSHGAAPSAFTAVGSLALLAVSFMKLPHLPRALTVITVAGVGLATACLWQLSLGGATEAILLSGGLPLLAAALWFRAWYRGSHAARGLVAVSLGACATWAMMTANAKLLSLDWTVQSWLPPLLWCVFVILCVLSLLAFMDEATTGACDVWAASLLVWHLAQAAVHEAVSSHSSPAEFGVAALALAQPVFAAPLAVALAQVLARTFGRKLWRRAWFAQRRSEN